MQKKRVESSSSRRKYWPAILWSLIALTGIFLPAPVNAAKPSDLAIGPQDSWRKHHFRSPLGTRRYWWVYQPHSVTGRSSPSPLVVMLHGCSQTPAIFAGGTQMNAIAQKEGFVVVYPEQPLADHKARCWNWALAKNQKHGQGEAALLVELIRGVLRSQPNLDKQRVYVAGMSAGGAMASNLTTCYPDFFAAGAVHSGVGFAVGRNEAEGLFAMKYGPSIPVKELIRVAKECPPTRTRTTPILILHGSSDAVVYRNAEVTLDQALGVAGLSRSNLVSKKHSQPLPALSQTGRQYDIFDYGSKAEPEFQLIRIQGLGHAWSGGNSHYSHTDSQMPDSSALIWSFFKTRQLP